MRKINIRTLAKIHSDPDDAGYGPNDLLRLESSTLVEICEQDGDCFFVPDAIGDENSDFIVVADSEAEAEVVAARLDSEAVVYWLDRKSALLPESTDEEESEEEDENQDHDTCESCGCVLDEPGDFCEDCARSINDLRD